MDRNEEDLLSIVGAVIVAVCLGSIALVAAGGWQWFAGFLAGQAASWAQAVFGGIAILAAYKLGRTQIRVSERQEAKKQLLADYRRLGTLKAILDSSAVALKLLRSRAVASAGLGSTEQVLNLVGRMALGSPGEIAEIKVRIAAIDPFNVPNGSVIITLVQIPHKLNMLIMVQEQYADAYAKVDWRDQKVLPPEARDAYDTYAGILNIVVGLLEIASWECASGMCELLGRPQEEAIFNPGGAAPLFESQR